MNWGTGTSDGTIFLATIGPYDINSKSYTIIPEDGSGTVSGAISLWSKIDDTTGSYAFSPMSEGARCICTQCSGTTVIVGQIPVVNVGGGVAESFSDTPYNYTPSQMVNKSIVPGEIVNSNGTGGFTSFSDALHRIVMIPNRLFQEFNTAKDSLRMAAGMFTLNTDACTVDFLDGSDVHISVKRSKGENPGTIEFWMGATGDVFKMSVNNQEFIHVDENRNVQITGKDINIDVKNVDIKCEKVKIKSDTVDIKSKSVTIDTTGTIDLSSSGNITFKAPKLDLTQVTNIAM